MKTFLQSILIIILICVVMVLMGVGIYHLAENNDLRLLPNQRGFESREGGIGGFNPKLESDSSSFPAHRRGKGGNRQPELSPVRGIVGIFRNTFVIVLITAVVVGIQHLTRVIKSAPRLISRL